MKRVLSAVLGYLKDWRNLLAHSVVGVAILLVALFLPVEPMYRVLVLVIVVLLNTLRMKVDKQRKTRLAEAAEE